MRWLKSNVGWIATLLGLAAGAGSIYIRAALADTEQKIAVLQTQQTNTDKRLDEIKAGVDLLVKMHLQAPPVPQPYYVPQPQGPTK